MSVSETYTDVVGKVAQPWPRSFDHVIHLPCPNCGAAPYQVCTYSPARNRPAPCVARR